MAPIPAKKPFIPTPFWAQFDDRVSFCQPYRRRSACKAQFRSVSWIKLNMKTFDMIVIGSGPGGQRAAIQAAKFGKRVALVEKDASFGGACIHTGTLPSKALRESIYNIFTFRLGTTELTRRAV